MEVVLVLLRTEEAAVAQAASGQMLAALLFLWQAVLHTALLSVQVVQ
jgi:hypothetical protein